MDGRMDRIVNEFISVRIVTCKGCILIIVRMNDCIAISTITSHRPCSIVLITPQPLVGLFYLFKMSYDGYIRCYEIPSPSHQPLYYFVSSFFPLISIFLPSSATLHFSFFLFLLLFLSLLFLSQ